MLQYSSLTRILFDMKTLAMRLRTARCSRGISQGDLAERTGILRVNICRIENGRNTDLRGSSLIKLSKALDVSTDYLLGLADDPRPRQ